jgi:hypothetical protein
MAKRKQTWERAARKRKALRIRKARAHQEEEIAPPQPKKKPAKSTKKPRPETDA